MTAVFVLIGFGLVLFGLTVAGTIERWRLRSRLPTDLGHLQTEGLPSDASIRTGELGRGAGSGLGQS